MQPAWMNSGFPHSAAPSGYNSYNTAPHPYVATPVSIANYGTTTTCSWAHTVPTAMPWTRKGGPEPFAHPPDPCTSQTAASWELMHNCNNGNSHVQLKRKGETDVVDSSKPQKQVITEERMAARFREMHISNQYSVPTANSFPLPENTNRPSATNLHQFDHLLIQSNQEEEESSVKSLVLAPEIKKLVEPEKMLMNTFLTKVERPTMALVVWQPPVPLVPVQCETKEESFNNNNNEFLPSLNTSSSHISDDVMFDEEMDT